jgi:hypothetical protein
MRALVEGVVKYGQSQWKQILTSAEGASKFSPDRTRRCLRDKWVNMLKVRACMVFLCMQLTINRLGLSLSDPECTGVDGVGTKSCPITQDEWVPRNPGHVSASGFCALMDVLLQGG